MSTYLKRTKMLAAAMLLAIAMLFGLASTSQAYAEQVKGGTADELLSDDAQAAESVDVTFTLSNKGSLVAGKDGQAVVNKSVTVADIDKDGKLTFDEALVAAHNAYYEGGAEAGYDPGTGFVNKLWGIETTNNLFFINNEGISGGVTAVAVKEGDSLYASINADAALYADWYVKFSKMDIKVSSAEDDITVNLTGHLGMAYMPEDMEFVPLEGIQIGVWKNGTFEAIEGAVTDEDGNATFKLAAGEYILTAQGTVEDIATDWNLIDLSFDQGWPRGTMSDDMMEWNVAYTDEDYGDGPYPANEVKYIDFYEEADESSDNDYAWQDLHYLKSNQLIADCPIMAPYANLTVGVPVEKIPYEGDTYKLVKDDLTSTFGMLSPSPEDSLFVSRSDGKINVKYTPKNKTIYAGIFMNADISFHSTWDDSNYITITKDADIEFSLDESYAGYAWPIAPNKRTDALGTTSAQYYMAIPALDKIPFSANKPIAKTGLTFNGKAQTGVEAGDGFTVENGSATNAGTYKATAKLEPGYVWSDGTDDDAEISFTIAKATVTTPTAKTGLVYNGSAQTGVASGAGYTISGNSGTNAGSYTAKLTADANHQFIGAKATVDVKWSIARAANPLKISKASSSLKLSKAKTKKGKAVAGAKVSAKGQGTVTYSITKVLNGKKKMKSFKKNFTINKKTGRITVKKIAKKGTYKVYVKAVTKGNVNYNGATKTAVVTIKVR